MITYFFDVTQTTVKLKEYTDEATQGNINQIKCIFNLSNEYKDLNVDAVFNGERVPIVNSECYAPSLNEVYCTVGVIGYIIENDKYKLRISPNPTSFIVKNGSYHEGLTQSKFPEPSELERHYSLIKELVDSGKLQGPPGQDGPQGIQGEQGIQGPPGKDAVIDTILSPESNNAIANSTVSKVLSDGNLVGIELIADYEQLMDFSEKYTNIETGEMLLKNDEYVILFVLCDIVDESGEILQKKSVYIQKNDRYYEIGEVSADDISAINKAINAVNKRLDDINIGKVNVTDFNETVEKLRSPRTKLNQISVYLPDLPDGVYELESEFYPPLTLIYMSNVAGDTRRMFLNNGDIFALATDGEGIRSLNIFTATGSWNIPNISVADWSGYMLANQKYVDELFSSIVNGNEVAF